MLHWVQPGAQNHSTTGRPEPSMSVVASINKSTGATEFAVAADEFGASSASSSGSPPHAATSAVATTRATHREVRDCMIER